MSDPGLFGPESDHLAGEPGGRSPRRRRRGDDPAGRASARRRGRRRALELPRGPVGPALPDARPDDEDRVRLDRDGATRRPARDPSHARRVHGETPRGRRRATRSARSTSRERPRARDVGARDARRTRRCRCTQRYVGTLSRSREQRRYYEEQKRLGEMFGVPVEHQPETLAEFYDYFDDMLERPDSRSPTRCTTWSTPSMRPELPFVARPLVEALNLATVGLLPARAARGARARTGARTGAGCSTPRASCIRRALPVLPAPTFASSRRRAAPTGASAASGLT